MIIPSKCPMNNPSSLKLIIHRSYVLFELFPPIPHYLFCLHHYMRVFSIQLDYLRLQIRFNLPSPCLLFLSLVDKITL